MDYKLWTNVCSLQKSYLTSNSINRMNARKGKKIYHENNNQRETEMTILISDKIQTAEHKKTQLGRDSIMIKDIIHLEDIAS